jgi:pyrroline-5-carboxylate reductase
MAAAPAARSSKSIAPKSIAPNSIVLAGAGKMGGAMLKAWLDRGLGGPGLTVIDPHPSPEVAALAQAGAFLLNEPCSPPEVLVLAIKPQSLDEAVSLAPLAAQETLVISILAGKTLADIAARFPQARAIIRAMPNLPAAVGRGITGVAASDAVIPAQKHAADALLAAIGGVEWLPDERLIDAVTAVSGSGPAYVFYLAECLASAGTSLGLPPEVAARLARATIEGAGELLYQSPGRTPADLRESVTSRGGTTAAALDVLMAAEGLEPLVARAVAAAKRRADELAG